MHYNLNFIKHILQKPREIDSNDTIDSDYVPDPVTEKTSEKIVNETPIPEETSKVDEKRKSIG